MLGCGVGAVILFGLAIVVLFLSAARGAMVAFIAAAVDRNWTLNFLCTAAMDSQRRNGSDADCGYIAAVIGILVLILIGVVIFANDRDRRRSVAATCIFTSGNAHANRAHAHLVWSVGIHHGTPAY